MSGIAKPFIQRLIRHIGRLRSERQASQVPISQPVDLMEEPLDETLDRLRGGNIDNPWWENILDRIKQPYIAPDFLYTPDLREWLSDNTNIKNIKQFVKTRINGCPDDTKLYSELIGSYSVLIEEDRELAKEIIDVLVGILSAGYFAAIPDEQRPLAAMVQSLPGHINQRFDNLESQISKQGIDPVTQRSHTDNANQELSKILCLRVFDSSKARREIQELIQRLKKGDLSVTHASTKATILLWGARLCAQHSQTITIAQDLGDELKQTEPDMDTSVVDALLLETEGETNEALHILREREDSDSRSVLFSILLRTHGREHALAWFNRQKDNNDTNFLTGVGWWQLAVTLSESGKWMEAADRLLQLQLLWNDAPTLAYLEGVINSALLLPVEFRDRALTTIPLCREITSISGEQADRYHARALACFEYSKDTFKSIASDETVEFISDWHLWVRLMGLDSDVVTAAREELQQAMQDGKRAMSLMPIAWNFNIDFDTGPIEEYLAKQKLLGGLSAQELAAELLHNKQSMSPHDFISYLQQHEKDLIEVISSANTTVWLIEALVEDGQITKARSILEKQTENLGQAVSNRISILIDTHEGINPQEQLESLYNTTGSLIDLKNLISHLKMLNDAIDLLPLLKEQFAREPNPENALEYIICLSSPPNFAHEKIIDFLDKHSDIAGKNDDLVSIKARALFHIGKFQEAKNVNNTLLRHRNHHNDLVLDVNIAIASGEWEHLSAIIDREWDKRQTHTAETLITLAQLAAQEERTVTRALELSRLAIDKAPENLKILVAANMLYYQLGKEAEADPQWLTRVLELSSESEGPAWKLDIQYLIDEWGPERQERFYSIEKNLLQGDIPIFVAASIFNIPIISFFSRTSRHNTSVLDGRKRVVLPIIAGGRYRVELQEEWILGLDITSIIVLSYLGLLQKSIDAFRYVKLAPETMEILFQEKSQVRFHQPSKIRAAEEIRDLVNQNLIKPVSNPSCNNKRIVEEVGPNMAELLQAAKENKGHVVCALPLHKFGSYLEEEADLGEYDDLIISTLDFCELLYEEGRIDTHTCDRATVFLKYRHQTNYSDSLSSILQHPIYFDSLALSYTYDSGLLQACSNCSLELWIHPSATTQSDELIRAGQEGERLVNEIEEIRSTLRNAVESGRLSYLLQVSRDNEQEQDLQPQPIFSLIQNSAKYDVLCVDERFVNRLPVVSEGSEQSKPIVCVLDLLHNLVSRQIISVDEHWMARHKLRKGGFALIPVESEELEYWLYANQSKNDEFRESVELRTIRQTTNHIFSSGMIDAQTEVRFVINIMSACGTTIKKIWEDTKLSITRTIRLSDWIWRSLMLPAGSAIHVLNQETHESWAEKSMDWNLQQLLMALIQVPAERHKSYTAWLEQSILEPLLPANASLVESFVEAMINILKELDEEQRNYGALILERTPKFLYQIFWNKAPQLMRRFGCEMQNLVHFGRDRKFHTQDLYAAAKDIYSEKQDVVYLKDTEGQAGTANLDKEHNHIVIEWIDEDSQSKRVKLPEMALLSSNREYRAGNLSRIMTELGPATPDFDASLIKAQECKLDYDEFLPIFSELNSGVASIQRRFLEKIRRGEDINIDDIIPPSLSYFEKFAGPLSGTYGPDDYINNLLVPYRKKLLQRDVQQGLDICLLGAFRENLMPGAWVHGVDNDVLLKAISSCNIESNPYSLLGALDIALYRQDDHRFKDLAENIVEKLAHNTFDQTGGANVLTALFALLADLILNRINLLTNGALQPCYWKRMCSWMQAGFITRAMMDIDFDGGLDSFQDWAHNNMRLEGGIRTVIDARLEPVFWTRNTSPESLHGEILYRLLSFKSFHEAAGRSIPNAYKIDEALNRLQQQGIPLSPGPLEGHIRPSQPLPKQATEITQEKWDGTTGSYPWPMLSVGAQFYALGETEQEYARNGIDLMSIYNDTTNLAENLTTLTLASTIAAISKDIELAGKIAEKVIELSHCDLQEHHVSLAIMILIHTSAAFSDSTTWHDWIEKYLARMAKSLHSDHSAQVFLNHCEAMNVVLPLSQSIHLRAGALASAFR